MNTTDVLLEGVVGSTAYGLAHEGSDEDKLGIYRAPIRDVLGLESNKAVDNSVVKHEPDVTHHEVGKYFRLALQCNPTVMELMWLPDDLYTVKTHLGEWIIKHRAAFLSTDQVRNRYFGYAYSQITRASLSTRPQKEKMARHCARLLYQGIGLLETGELQVDVSDKRDRLFDLGRWATENFEVFQHETQPLLDRLRTMPSVLPDKPLVHAVNNALISIRMEGTLDYL